MSKRIIIGDNVNLNTIKSIFINIMIDEIKLASATGFIVNKSGHRYLITNRHVVTGRDNQTDNCLDINAAIPNNLRIWLPNINQDKVLWHELKINLYDNNYNPLWLEHPIYANKVDVVAIDIGTIENFEFYYNINSTYKAIVTEEVFIIGYPFGYDIRPGDGKFAIWSRGTIASDPDLDVSIKGDQLPAFLVDSKTRMGQSGSPVIYYNENGINREKNGIAMYSGPVIHEIGIYSGRINAESDIGYVWKWRLIEEIINN